MELQLIEEWAKEWLTTEPLAKEWLTTEPLAKKSWSPSKMLKRIEMEWRSVMTFHPQYECACRLTYPSLSESESQYR